MESNVSLIHKYYCEICGREKSTINNWCMAEVKEQGLLLSAWREARAPSAAVHHFCGEAHAQVFVSRYLAAPEKFGRFHYKLNANDKDLTAVQSHLVNRVMQQSDDVDDEDEMFDLLAAAEAALKGRVTVDSLNSDHFDA
jgi:predicted Fe-S protein YdhL (DUF1289 family)